MEKPRSFTVFQKISLFWLLLLGAMGAYYQAPFLLGEEVVVKVQPVDPRDFFRGDYVILSYPFSRVEVSKELQDLQPQPGSVYTLLTPNSSGVYELQEVVVEEPKQGIFLKGTLQYSSGDSWNINYGIESYFVQEGEGRVIEVLRNQDRVEAVLAITSSGYARIKTLRIDGEEISDELIDRLRDEEGVLDESFVPQERRELGSSAQFIEELPQQVMTLQYDEENWQFDESAKILRHRNTDASIRLSFSLEEEKPLWSCQGVSNVEFCGERTVGSFEYHVREFLEDGQKRTEMYRAEEHWLPREEDAQQYKVFQLEVLIPEDNQDLQEELEDMLNTLWVRNY